MGMFHQLTSPLYFQVAEHTPAETLSSASNAIRGWQSQICGISFRSVEETSLFCMDRPCSGVKSRVPMPTLCNSWPCQLGRMIPRCE